MYLLGQANTFLAPAGRLFFSTGITCVDISQHSSTAGQARIDRWLATFGLHDCAAPLAAAGYETMDDLFALQLGPGDDTLMSEHALISAGVASSLARATLLKHLKAASRWQAALALPDGC